MSHTSSGSRSSRKGCGGGGGRGRGRRPAVAPLFPVPVRDPVVAGRGPPVVVGDPGDRRGDAGRGDPSPGAGEVEGEEPVVPRAAIPAVVVEVDVGVDVRDDVDVVVGHEPHLVGVAVEPEGLRGGGRGGGGAAPSGSPPVSSSCTGSGRGGEGSAGSRRGPG